MASFHDVKVGDLVVIEPASFGRYKSRQIKEVERVTRTHFLAGDYRFFRKDGAEVRAVSGFETRAWAYPGTPELLAEVEAENRYRRATERTHKLICKVEGLRLDIDGNPNPHHWAATLEAAAEHLTAAVERLQLRVEEEPTPPTTEAPQ
jgi:hypothetical protein